MKHGFNRATTDFKGNGFLINQLIITHLGTGNEMGRSCAYTSYKGKTILFDSGILPAYTGTVALPYFDEIDPSTIDVLLVIPFHLDHAASLPYYLGEDISVHSDSNMKARFLKQHLQLQSIKLFPTQALGACDFFCMANQSFYKALHQNPSSIQSKSQAKQLRA